MKIRIQSMQGTWYEFILESGNVTRYNEHNWPETHDSWRFAWLCEIRPFCRLYWHPMSVLLDLIKQHDSKAFLFKNGKARFTIGDMDHGTRRSHGDGIRNAWIMEGAE